MFLVSFLSVKETGEPAVASRIEMVSEYNNDRYIFTPHKYFNSKFTLHLQSLNTHSMIETSWKVQFQQEDKYRSLRGQAQLKNMSELKLFSYHFRFH